MSTVKIQIFQLNAFSVTEVRVDNKFAYTTPLSPNEETTHINKLIQLLEIDNVEVTNKEIV